MKKRNTTRREFLQTSAAAAVGAMTPYWLATRPLFAAEAGDKNDRLGIACIGLGYRFKQLAPEFQQVGDILAVCDVDRSRAEEGRQLVGGKAEIVEDYRKLLDNKDIDIMVIVTPDHWHTKILIESLRAGKDCYCEKPLTLTIDEGKHICRAVEETNRIVQVGTQQRSEFDLNFVKAVAMIRDDRIGNIKKITAGIGDAPRGGPFAEVPVPPGLNWEVWLGQAPLVPYVKERCHYNFRWWYEYSGGKMTDWVAHHVDIATWAMEAGDTGPILVEGKGEIPNIPNGYNVATAYDITCKYANGVELLITDKGDNGILFEGTKGRIFANRESLKGKPVEQLKDDPLPEDAISKLYGDVPTTHVQNFVKSVASRKQPISDVFTHHRALSTCHLANIALRLGRKLQWDPQAQQIVGDAEAEIWLSRPQRKGYEIPA